MSNFISPIFTYPECKQRHGIKFRLTTLAASVHDREWHLAVLLALHLWKIDNVCAERSRSCRVLIFVTLVCRIGYYES